MPIAKNQCITLTIQSLASDGSGVGHYEGEAIFVPGTAPGDEAEVRIVKDCGRYAFGRLLALRAASPDRVPADCPVAQPCGGCSLRHISYPAELRAKGEMAANAFARIGGLQLPVLPALPSPQQDRYRNKVQFPVGSGEGGALCIGFYAGRSHRIVPCGDCKLQPAILNEIGHFICTLLSGFGLPAYDEASGRGLLRHIFLRMGAHSGEIMVCLVATKPTLPPAAVQALVSQLTARYPAVKTVLVNHNPKNTNVILGESNRVLFGSGVITDTMCGVPVQLGPFSFYQVNTPAAEQLYAVAARYAALQPHETLLDLYCGMGTIGLSMARQCRALVGVEIVPEAVASARQNAARMGPDIAAKCRFLCADAGTAAARLAAEGLRPDVITLDPPRKGCDAQTLAAVLQMAPGRIVYISCNPATCARDTAWLAEHGYRPLEVQPVDLFPRTRHVEAVVLLCHKKT